MSQIATTSASKVLYVEDDEIILDLGRIALAEVGGLVVHLCQSGQDALDALHDFRPDLLLFDVIMPGMDGPMLLNEIRRRHLTDAPVIFMTSRVDYADVKRYMALGAIAVVKKPFDPLTLAEDLIEILANKSPAKQAGTTMLSPVVQTEGNGLFSRLPE